MKKVHLILPSLFLPTALAEQVYPSLQLPALKKLLARGTKKSFKNNFAPSLEQHLCAVFGVATQTDLPIAAISAVGDGLPAGNWLRADPVHVHLQRDRLVLSGTTVSSEEAQQFCAELNRYFAEQGLTFFAPHPQRWYMQLKDIPKITTTPLSQVMGENIRSALPTGDDAAQWHQLFNEIQMLLFSLPLNDVREQRGEAAINSVWFWGAGQTPEQISAPYASVSADTPLAAQFAAAAQLPFTDWQTDWQGDALLVWTALQQAAQQGDFAQWQDRLQQFETQYAQPLWQALCRGEVESIRMDILGTENPCHIQLQGRDTWAFWRQDSGL
jgi:hypothetical protein